MVRSGHDQGGSISYPDSRSSGSHAARRARALAVSEHSRRLLMQRANLSVAQAVVDERE
jgi:hypothetical protein